MFPISTYIFPIENDGRSETSTHSHKYYLIMPKIPSHLYRVNGYNTHIHKYHIRSKIPKQQMITNQPSYQQAPFVYR
jgi:hypothetical protein